MTTITMETYNKLKNEYLNYRNQSEETLKEYQKAIKLLRETGDALKRENHKLKTEQSSKDQSKEIKKLKEDKLLLSKQLMDFESEVIAYKDKPSNMLLSDYTYDSFAFSLNNNNSVNKQTIKDNLKNKNEEILILKNELVKKEKAMLELMKKDKEREPYTNVKPFMRKVNGCYLYRTKSDQDLIRTVIVKNMKKYFDAGSQLKRVVKEEKKGKGGQGYTKLIANRAEDSKQSGAVTPHVNRRRLEELNISLENDNEDEGHSTLEKNIFQEIKNILEEKRNFILQTMTYENFSFDILSIPKPPNKTALNSLSNSSATGSNLNQQPQSVIQTKLTHDIDLMLDKIKRRKGVVDSQRSKLETMLNQYEISNN